MEEISKRWNYKSIVIGIVSVGILLVGSFFVFNTIFSSQKNTSELNNSQVSNEQTYSDKPLDHLYSFVYPSMYTIKTGSRPYNANDEGFSYTSYANCTQKDVCSDTQSNFSVTAYENRQNWNLEEWIQKSTYAPQQSCTKKDVRSTLSKEKFGDYTSYHFVYISDKDGVGGCSDGVESVGILNGDDMIFLYGKTIYVVSRQSDSEVHAQELESMLSSFKFLD